MASGAEESPRPGGIIKPGTLLTRCEPFVHVGRIQVPHSQIICDNCLMTEKQVKFQLEKDQPEGKKVESRFGRCSACQMVWYCNKICQKKGWKEGHKYECKNMEFLKCSLDFFGEGDKAQSLARMVLRAIMKLQDGTDYFEEYDIGGTKVNRRFQDLMSIGEELQANVEHMEAVEVVIRLTSSLLGPRPKLKIPDQTELFEIVGRVISNAHDIRAEGVYGVGYGVYLARSVFRHSCNNMAAKTYEGAIMTVRSIMEIPKSVPFDKMTVSYVSVLAPSQERRKKLMYWNINCNCERCEKGQFDREMRSIICRIKGCNAEIDTEKIRNPCHVCGHVMDDGAIAKVREAEAFVNQFRNTRKSFSDLRSIEVCLEKLKTNHFSDTHWLMLYLYHLAFGVAGEEGIKSGNKAHVQKAYEYGSKYIAGLRCYLHENDENQLRIRYKMISPCILLKKMEEASKYFREAKSIAEILYGKDSLFVQRRFPEWDFGLEAAVSDKEQLEIELDQLIENLVSKLNLN